jgi:hypothetical protein
MPSGSRLVHTHYGKIGPEREWRRFAYEVTMHRGELWERYSPRLHIRATVPCRGYHNDGQQRLWNRPR